MLIPYIWLSWMHRCKRLNEPFEYPERIKELVDEVTRKHILSNSHHPEYHLEGDLDSFTRDSAENHKLPPLKIKNMPKLDLIELACDWTAMSQELNQNGGSAREWADKNIGTRWIFTENNKKFIYKVINDLDRLNKEALQ
jgi:hypothetical protein